VGGCPLPHILLPENRFFGYLIEEEQIKNWSEVGESGVCILRTDFKPVFLHFLT
jgi:hypothetical protein